MFTDARSRSILFVSHCILNQNAISDGTADYPASIREVAELLFKSHVGVVQMPCPELWCLGLDRGDRQGAARPVVEENTRIRAAMTTAPAAGRLTALTDQVVFQILEYRAHDFDIRGIVGINRSPSCGVESTSRDNREVVGQGVFIEAVRAALARHGVDVPMVGIKARETERAVARIRDLLGLR